MTILETRPTGTPVTRTGIAWHQLTPQQQNAWHQHLAKAFAADEDGDRRRYLAAHQEIAAILGVHLPKGHVLVECACAIWGCPDACDAITDSFLCSEYQSGRQMLPQCPACDDDHPRTGD